MNPNRLAVLGSRIKAVDRLFVHLLARRLRLSEEVAMLKLESGDGLYHPGREDERLANVQEWAGQDGINSHFARAMLYAVIGESCKTQMVIADKVRRGDTAERFAPTYEAMRTNLLRLAENWAPKYDEQFGRAHPATTALIQYENSVIDRTLDDTRGEQMLELGCATGRQCRRLRKHFGRLTGFDISPAMIDAGRQKLTEHSYRNVFLQQHDVELDWPVEPESLDLVVMNLGTASDVRNLRTVLYSIERALKVGGKFVLSFYNANAWAQRIFFPWPLGLIAGIDMERSCLEVQDGHTFIPIFARAYSVEEIPGLLPRHLNLEQISTYPTLQSILPAEVMADMGGINVLGRIDEMLATDDSNLGAYIIASGRKY